MVSADPKAISAILSAPSTDTTPGLAAAAERPADWTEGTFYVLVPDISDETAAAITKAKAWPAWTAFFRSLRRRSRKGPSDKAKAAARSGVLDDEGIRGLARSIGTTPKAMSRQVAALQALGILAAFRPPASMTRDPDTGRMVRRPCKAGRVEAARIVLTIGQDHLRPANRQGSDRPLGPPAGTKGAKAGLRVDRTPSQADPKGRSDTTPRPLVSRPLVAPPAAGEDARPAEAPQRRPDGRRGGQRPPGHEGGRDGLSDPDRPHNATTEATPTPPAGTEAGTQGPTGGPAGRVDHLDRPGHRDRTETTPAGPQRQDLGGGGRPGDNVSPADSSGMDPSLGSWLAAYRQGLGLPATEATTPDKAAEDLRRSLDELPADSRQRAADLGEDLAGIEDEAKRLAEIVQRRQAETATKAKVEAKAKAAGHRQAWHRKRKAKAEAA